MKHQLSPGDLVRVVAYTCGRLPRQAVGHPACVTAINNYGGVHIQLVDRPRERYYVPGESVGACLERVT
jgi:hypothetical protein